MGTLCPSCNTFNENGRVMCKKCGRRIEGSSQSVSDSHSLGAGTDDGFWNTAIIASAIANDRDDDTSQQNDNDTSQRSNNDSVLSDGGSDASYGD